MHARRASIAVAIFVSLLLAAPLAAEVTPSNFRPWFEPSSPDGVPGFVARGPDYLVRITRAGADVVWRDQGSTGARAALQMELVGANPRARIEGMDELSGKAHYYIGNDASRWRIDVGMYNKVRVVDVWPGIDAVFYADKTGRLEYDFVVRPGASVTTIVIGLNGAAGVRLASDGDLMMQIAGREVVQRKPVIYQATRDGRRAVEGEWRLRDHGRVGFKVGDYDRSEPLVIDPVIVYSTFLGGTRWDLGQGIATDQWGNTYVVGVTESDTFPPFMGTVPDPGNRDVFVAAFDPAGVPMFATYLGGTGPNDESGYAIAAHPTSGLVYVTGFTGATNFPTTPSAFQTSDPDAVFDLTGALIGNGQDAFVTVLGFWGRTVYSTYLGDTAQMNDWGTGIAVDDWGLIYVTGVTESGAFPTTWDAFQPFTSGLAQQNVFVTVLDSLSQNLLYSTYLSAGWQPRIAVGPTTFGMIDGFVVSGITVPGFPTTPGAAQPAFGGGGYDGFVTRFAPWVWTGVWPPQPTYSTYLGGAGYDVVLDVKMDASGNTFVAGGTDSTNFPTTPLVFQAYDPDVIYDLSGNVVRNSFDAFATKLDRLGAVVTSTYLGGSEFEYATAIAADASGNPHVAGVTSSVADFPIFAPLKIAPVDAADMFVTKLDAFSERLLFSTYLGGEEFDYAAPGGIAVDASGHAHVTGYTFSKNQFPLINSFASVNNDVASFVTKIDPTQNTSADLSMSSSVNLLTISVGQQVAYTMRVFNNTGPAIATNLSVSFNLSPGQTMVAVTAVVSQTLGGTGTPQPVPCWTYSSGGTCTVRALSQGGMVTVRVETKGTAPGTITINGFVIANEPDPTPNTTTAAVTVM